jgi:hypothetical protein
MRMSGWLGVLTLAALPEMWDFAIVDGSTTLARGNRVVVQINKDWTMKRSNVSIARAQI